MQITEVTVTVHEKRNHPHEYGHYDCSVTLTAEPIGNETTDEVVARLRGEGAAHVQEHLDGWIAGITGRYKLAGLIDRMEYASSTEKLEIQLEELYAFAAQLPADEAAKGRTRANQVYEERREALAVRAAAEREDPAF